PIEEMTSATAVAATRPPGARVQMDYPITREALVAAFRKALDWNRPFSDRSDETHLVGAGIAGLDTRQIGTLLRPIATPLVMSGFDAGVGEMLGTAFQDQGFVPTGGGALAARAGEMPYEGPLKPGDAIGVNFITGDLLLGGTGTVTHIDGDRVYAFG